MSLFYTPNNCARFFPQNKRNFNQFTIEFNDHNNSRTCMAKMPLTDVAQFTRLADPHDRIEAVINDIVGNVDDVTIKLTRDTSKDITNQSATEWQQFMMVNKLYSLNKLQKADKFIAPIYIISTDTKPAIVHPGNTRLFFSQTRNDMLDIIWDDYRTEKTPLHDAPWVDHTEYTLDNYDNVYFQIRPFDERKANKHGSIEHGRYYKELYEWRKETHYMMVEEDVYTLTRTKDCVLINGELLFYKNEDGRWRTHPHST